MKIRFLYIFIPLSIFFLTIYSCRQECPAPRQIADSTTTVTELSYITTLGPETSSLELFQYDSTAPIQNFPNIFVGIWAKDSLKYYRYRFLLQLNLSQIPANSLIDSAFITFYPTNDTVTYANIQPATNKNYGDNSMYLEQITTAWSSSNTLWSNQPTPSLVNMISVPNIGTGNSGSGKISIVSFVKNWVANPVSNYGMLLKLQNDTSQIGRRVYFASNYNSDATLHPLLEIYYRK